ncbi:hypothetical protein HF519_23340 [Pseudonocardia bannensis]|uniref:Uncharacterized protein n=1 Tax=Pseudonocardia bannensis TaxID=630973 RepID=A0A848DPU0_9PSEU|nr:hypothetical protein [Pseudonocardia bannensis]NMH94456.1 hypothetical protein [Pseudonocardia bannensis]
MPTSAESPGRPSGDPAGAPTPGGGRCARPRSEELLLQILADDRLVDAIRAGRVGCDYEQWTADVLDQLRDAAPGVECDLSELDPEVALLLLLVGVASGLNPARQRAAGP